MEEAKLTIYESGESREAELDPQGMVIGRSGRCDVVVDSRDVSREHARVFLDPFGRWVFEDLGSSNGMFVNGKRMEACAVFPGESVVIGPASLSISHSLEHEIEPDASVEAMNIVVEDFETEIFYGRGKRDVSSAVPCPERLSEITERLLELTSSSALYPDVCRRLARAPKTVAVVLRVPGRGKPVPKSPDVLACHFGGSPDDDTAGQVTPGYYPSHLAFRVSHRVLDEVRSGGEALMAKSIYSSDTEVTVTVVDEHSPRAVICAPLGDVTKEVDLLYLDVPIGESVRVPPEEMFAFVRAVAKEVTSARESLAPMHVKAKRSTLDHELSLAQQIQLRLAPVVPEDLPGVDAAVVYEPVIWVGGDYCDVWRVADGRLAFAVGDINERGLPAAMALSSLRTLLRSTMHFCSELSDVVRHVNSSLMADCPGGISGTLLLGLFDGAKGALEYVNAGHPEPLIAAPGAGIKRLGQAGSSGLGGGDVTFQTNVETVGDGAELIVFTDGLINAQSPDGEEFGIERLTHLLKSSGAGSAGQIADSITKAVTDFQKRVARQDDITAFVLVKRK